MYKFLFFIFSLSLLILNISSLKVFYAWEQVSTLWNGNINPLSLFGHPHFPRYILAYPGFLLQELLPINGFSIYISVFFAINVLLLTKVSLLINHRRPSIFIFTIFIATHMAMNGRGVIAWTSWLICLWVCLKLKKKIARPFTEMGWITLSCWFAAVSTGVFILVITTFIIYLSKNIKLGEIAKSEGKVRTIFFVLPISYVFLHYFIVAIEKNLDFYGGGVGAVFNMLQHGLGIVLINLTPINLLLIITMGFLSVFIVALVTLGRSMTDHELFIVLPLMGGFFGYTVLTLIIPSLFLRISALRFRLISINSK